MSQFRTEACPSPGRTSYRIRTLPRTKGMPDADFSKGTTSFPPGITLSTEGLRNSYPHPTAAFCFVCFSEEPGAAASQSRDPPWFSPGTLSPHWVSAEIPPRDNRQKTIPEDDRYPLAPVVLESVCKCEPQPAELRVLPEPTQQAALLGLGVGGPSPRSCAWQMVPDAHFSRGLSCFLTPEVLPVLPALSNSELWDPEAGRIATGNAYLPHPRPLFRNSCRKSKREPLLELTQRSRALSLAIRNYLLGKTKGPRKYPHPHI